MNSWENRELRELDAKVAEKCFSHVVIREKRPGGEMYINDPFTILPHYSTDIRDAWEVVNHMGMFVFVGISRDGGTHDGGWRCNMAGYAGGRTAMEAICRAAIMAVDCGIGQ